MTLAVPRDETVTGRPRRLGDPAARLLAGPAGGDAETLEAHLGRLGALAQGDRHDLLAGIEAAGVGGRGGGGFPVARKLAGAGGRSDRGVAPLVIVNAAESEPASRKDRTLCTLRPHLVLDGAAVAAAIVKAEDAAIYCHSAEVAASMGRAAAERSQAAGAKNRLPDPQWRVLVGPDRFVAGESTAAASFVDGGQARPRVLRAPVAVAGVSGRPTVVHNAETLAHLALVARFGPSWWRQAGTAVDPGSRLVTLAGAVFRPGLVLEVVEPVTIGALLSEAGVPELPAAVLIGGYAGRWVSGDVAWTVAFDPASLRRVGAAVGCGLIGALPAGACPISETARLAAYLAAQSAGQCGPCVYGLSDVAELVGALATGRARHRDVRLLRQRLHDVTGRGGCRHPDGVASMVSSALEAFPEEVERHLRGRCRGAAHSGILPLPDDAGSLPWR